MVIYFTVKANRVIIYLCQPYALRGSATMMAIALFLTQAAHAPATGKARNARKVLI